MHRTFLVGLLALVGGCHPLTCFHPADLPRDPPLLLQSSADFPKDDVEILVDDFGVPHIFGQTEADLAYGLGVMHARDRLWQLYLFVHAGNGRLTELLGEDLLPVDRQNRVLLYRADETLAAGTERDRQILEAYCSGVNQGATMVGRTAEMSVLGVDWEPITPRDVLAIVRLQQWDQAVGFSEELTRWRLTKALAATEPAVLAELMQDTPSGGVPIVAPDEHTGDAFTPPAPLAQPHAAPGARVATAPAATTTRVSSDSLVRKQLADEIAEMFGRGGRGASNSWSVHGSKTESGAPILANDPHLSHSAPGIFYMVHMEGPDFTVAGGSFVGIPGVLIGHGRDVAWGITNAFADTQDLVVLNVLPGQDDSYVVDGTEYAFTKLTQKFKMGKGADAVVVEETHLASIFGYVLSEQWGSYGGATPVIDPGEKIALQWTATEMPEENGKLVTAFWDLAKSKTLEDATAAVQNFSSPAMSMNMVFTDGTIAYRLSGVIPVRDAQRADFPRDGSKISSLWTGRMPAAQKPQTENPAKGYIVASNQRIVDNDVHSQAFVGFEAGKPWRAMRIDQRVRETLDAGKPTADALLAIQQDSLQLEAAELAPIYGAHCPRDADIDGHDKQRVLDFCDSIAAFDGVYSVDANAIAYARLHRELQLEVFDAHVSTELAEDLVGESFSGAAWNDLVKREHAGEIAAAFFDDPRTTDREGLDGFMLRATKRALDLLVADGMGSKGDWRWGNWHKLSLRGALASAPVIGFLFETSAREEGGVGNAVRAEGSDASRKFRVSGGAGLRLIAEMTTPPTIRMINDSGQSGHFGHRHLEDQYPLWSKGEVRLIAQSKEQVREKLEGAMVIKPRG